MADRVKKVLKIIGLTVIVISFISLWILFVRSCINDDHRLGSTKATSYENVKIERISTVVDAGLNLITLDDTTKILLYYNNGGSSMIQLK